MGIDLPDRGRMARLWFAGALAAVAVGCAPREPVTPLVTDDLPMPLVIARHGVPTTRALVCADGSPDCQAAVEALAWEEFGSMVALQAGRIVTVPLKQTVNQQKFVDPEGEMVRTALAVGVTFCAPD